MKDSVIRSQNNYGASFVFLVLCFLGAGAGAVWIWIAHWEPGYFIPLVLLALFSVMSCFALLEWDRLTIYDGKLEVRSLLGYVKKVIYLDDIVSWTEINKKNKYLSWTDLTLFTLKGKYKITSTCYINYQTLKHAVAKVHLRDSPAEKRWMRRHVLRYSAGLSIIGLLFLAGAARLYQQRDITVLPGQLSTVAGIVSNDVKIGHGRGGAQYLDIQLKSCPGFTFTISGDAYDATRANAFAGHVRQGDSVFMDIEQVAYRKKITQELPLTFWDRSAGFRTISVLGLRDKQYHYLTLEDYNMESKPGTGGIIFMAFMGLSLLGVSGLLAYRKKTDAGSLPGMNYS